MILCNNPTFRQQIIDLLYSDLFNIQSNGCLEEWYDLMTNHLNDSNNVWQKLNPGKGIINVDRQLKPVSQLQRLLTAIFSW